MEERWSRQGYKFKTTVPIILSGCRYGDNSEVLWLGQTCLNLSDWMNTDVSLCVSVCVCAAVHSVSQGVVCVLLALLCVTVLMLPLQSESSSVVPRCLYVSTNQKLACAYTLGNTYTHTHTPVSGRSEKRRN